MREKPCVCISASCIPWRIPKHPSQQEDLQKEKRLEATWSTINLEQVLRNATKLCVASFLKPSRGQIKKTDTLCPGSPLISCHGPPPLLSLLRVSSEKKKKTINQIILCTRVKYKRKGTKRVKLINSKSVSY